MTMYKATVRNKQTDNYEVISGEYSSKKAFIEDLRRNGYAVNDKKVKKADVYDAIIKYTDCDDDAWTICNTVEAAMDIFAAYERYFEKREKMYSEKYGECTEEQPEEIKKNLDNFFLDKDFIINDDNLQDSIFLYNIDGVVYGCDGEFERYKNTCVRGCDHNTLYSNIDNFDFIELIKKVAVIVPEIKQYYYTGQDNKIIKLLNKLNYSEVEA